MRTSDVNHGIDENDSPMEIDPSSSSPCKIYHKELQDEKEIMFSTPFTCGNCPIKQLGTSDIKKAGPYFIGPVVKKFVSSPFTTQCIVKKEGSDKHYMMKMLVLHEEQLNDKIGVHRRTLFHTEYSILSFLKDQAGVIKMHDFFKDSIFTDENDKRSKVNRMCMVLECFIPHEDHNPELTPLTMYIKEKKRLGEYECLVIFHNLLQVVEQLHARNLVHKDLKVSNIVLNRRTLQVKLTNFYYAKLLGSDGEVSRDQRGTPTYIAPDIIAGKPFAPKPCDMWSLGVILFTMIHGHLPFMSTTGNQPNCSSTRSLAELYAKIIRLDYSISTDFRISDGTKKLIRSLLCQNPNSRLSAPEALNITSALLIAQSSSQNPSLAEENKDSQIVPHCTEFDIKDIVKVKRPKKMQFQLILDPEPVVDHALTYSITISGADPREAKRMRTEEDGLSGEKDVFLRHGCPLRADCTSASNHNSLVNVAMLRLGATSVSSISALSFNYSERKNH